MAKRNLFITTIMTQKIQNTTNIEREIYKIKVQRKKKSLITNK